jgi:hypothetical protein
MRRSRRNGHGGLEFGGSGEDSFVAVVVTKLTGALLFILLLTMVIMALLPKAIDSSLSDQAETKHDVAPLAIATPEMLPEAIAGRPYAVALAATGGAGPLHWSVDGPIPSGLAFDAASGQFRGTPREGTTRPAQLVLRVSDGSRRAAQPARLIVYEADRPLTTPSSWKPGLPPIPWRAWLEQGFGFLMLWLIHVIGMNALRGLERWSLNASREDPAEDEENALRRRYRAYRTLVRLASLGAAAGLALWLWLPRT